jgi:hypothetical protein
MRIVPILFLLALASAEVTAQTPQVERLDVVEHGLFTADVVRTEVGANGVPKQITNNSKLVKTTRDVPAKLGVRFGFRFTVTGEPKGEQVSLKKVTIYPRGGRRVPGTNETITRSESTSTRVLGDPGLYTGYSFDDASELLPGTWTFELWHGDRKLTSQSFKVFKP